MPRDRPWRDPATLLQIHESASMIVEFAAGVDRGRFLMDALTQDAVILRIILLGEASKRLSEGFRCAHPEIPWAKIAGMRDRLVHDYDRWDIALVWDVVTREIPALLEKLGPLLPKPEARE
jgi:uncharacterized protein with HEPN domain